MQITCPTCRKKNADTEICVRCECDLRSLIFIAKASTYYLEKAYHDIEKGYNEKAFSHACKSWDLKHSQDSAKIAFFAKIMISEDNNEISKWFQRANSYVN